MVKIFVSMVGMLVFLPGLMSASSASDESDSDVGLVYKPYGKPALLDERQVNYYKKHERSMSISYSNFKYFDPYNKEELGFLAALRDEKLSEMKEEEERQKQVVIGRLRKRPRSTNDLMQGRKIQNREEIKKSIYSKKKKKGFFHFLKKKKKKKTQDFSWGEESLNEEQCLLLNVSSIGIIDIAKTRKRRIKE